MIATQNPIEFTPGALREIRFLMRKNNVSDKKLRVGVKNGGCSGMSYILDFDVPLADDLVFDFDGIACIMRPLDIIYLEGMRIDFPEGLDARGFIFENPNAATTCGCGTSFNTGKPS